MANYIQVASKKFGTRCNSSTSFEVSYKNTSNEKLITAICFQKNDGTWKGQTDFGINSGETQRLYICEDANGSYKVFAMKFSESAGCEYPKCK
jgi:hypothetical protein